MGKLRKFWRLPAPDRHLLACATALVVVTRLGLVLLGYPAWRRLLFRFQHNERLRQNPDPEEVARVVWAVTAAGRRFLGRKPCLTEALVTQLLLSRRGVLADLRLGVARGDRGQLDAHAWIELEGRVLIGDSSDLERYSRFPPLGPSGRPNYRGAGV